MASQWPEEGPGAQAGQGWHMGVIAKARGRPPGPLQFFYFQKCLKLYIINNTEIPNERPGLGLWHPSVLSPGHLHVVGCHRSHSLSRFRKYRVCEPFGSSHSLQRPNPSTLQLTIEMGKNQDELHGPGALLILRAKTQGSLRDGDVGKTGGLEEGGGGVTILPKCYPS